MRQVIAFFKLIRTANLLIIAFTMYAVRFGILYPLLKVNHLHLQMPEVYFFLLTLSTVMIAAAGYIINDYFDTKTDAINNPENLIVGKFIKRRVAMGAHLVINFLGIAIAIGLAWKIGFYKLAFIQVIAACALWYYSANLKGQLIAGNLVVAFLAALVPFTAGIYGLMLILSHAHDMLLPFIAGLPPKDINIALTSFQYSTHNMLHWVLAYSAFAFFITLIREIVKDIEDIEGDMANGLKTFPVVYGIGKSKNITLIITVLMLIFTIWFQYKQFQIENTYFMYYATIFMDIPLIIFSYLLIKSNGKKQFKQCSNFLKFIMLLGILYLPIFYFSVLNIK